MKKEQPSLESRLLLGSCIVIVALHVWGALQPSHMNWGVHFFGLFDPAVSLSALACLLLAAYPPVQIKILGFLDQFFARTARLPLGILFALITGIVFIAGYYFAAKLHLLGDGILLLRSLSLVEWGENIRNSFNNQPLMFWIARTSYTSHLIESPEYTYSLYVWIDRLGAAIFLGMTFACLRSQAISLTEKVLLGCFLFFGGGSQFFFGYIENYVLQYVLTGCYAVLGWFALERRISIAAPVICLIVILGLHLGNIVFLPSLALLLLLYYDKYRVQALIGMVILGLGGIAVIYALGFLPALMRHFTPESVDFLQPFKASGGNFPYAMFSLLHLIDWWNYNLLVAPFGIIIAVLLLFPRAANHWWTDRSALFLVMTAFCGLLFTWVVNTSLGMARDWDLLAGFLVPLMILDVYLISRSPSADLRRGTMFIVVVVMLLHFGSWIGVNASETRHLARARLLNDPRLISLTSQLFYDESLANYFYDHGNYADARGYYEHFISIDEKNPRIIGNISDVYRHLGEKEKYFEMLKRAVAMKSPDPGVYSNLGVEYAGRADTVRAIELNEQAVAMDSTQAKAHANLGLLYVSRKMFPVALPHFISAINLGLADPVLYKYTADLSLFLHDDVKAIHYYDIYLRMAPNDHEARSAREQAVKESQNLLKR